MRCPELGQLLCSRVECAPFEYNKYKNIATMIAYSFPNLAYKRN
jgi:hypothetical protein